MFVKDNGNKIIISPNGYTIDSDDLVEEDFSNFELWAFIHEMVEEEDGQVRQEAMNRFFDVYCTLYNFFEEFQNCQFITE